ncbi:hypothetical protein GALMADRAFT_233295 [Galerina marginata CBS 339.88]|uniref:Uncharacterized protein n=1 Tax=Galerina marginata (strain CBS 339.88) TaxID=685588 RepID=A0A067TNV5_GALM3|nr:hypothetical protein GALMADRAFT_233295 [Galerina marginata CBS 339.88]
MPDRSSIRQSLNFSSVGKAFADAIGKDPAKKAKEASRRSSVLPPAPRASMGDVSKRTATPDSKPASTRRRVSASYQRSSSDDQSSKPTDTISPPTRTSTLRPRNLNATTSALPKYRPKSVLEPATGKPPSPVQVKAGTRRRFSTSDDEKKEQKRPSSAAVTPAEKVSRPISPLPHRAALQANLTNSVNATPPTTPSKPRLTTPVSSKSSPSRPSKIVKTGASAALPRPPSSSSSSLSLQPHATPKSSTPKVSTPKNSGLKAKLGLSRSAQDKGRSGGTITNGSPSRDSPSPLARHSRKNSKMITPASSSLSGNMSHISEGNSEGEDSDVEDVALLLAPVAAFGAPTPAMPRIQASRKRIVPQTPTRPGLPSRANMSYLSPLPPTSADNSSSSLRPPQRQNQTATDRAMRGSILSWEQLASETSITLGEDEFGRMLSDIPAPFHSGAPSPSLSSQMELSVPESPALSAIDSPGGYGSISQVLLPDVTPSPALHANLQQSRFSLSPDAAAVSDSATATMLRLQLAAAENTGRERLFQIQAVEEEMYHLKQAHAHQMEETEKQMVYMEVQWRAADERAAGVVRLEEQLRVVQMERERAVAEAVARYREQARVERERMVRAEGLRCEALSSARLASSSWSTVRDACDTDLDVLRGDRAVLSVLLAQLDQMCYAI